MEYWKHSKKGNDKPSWLRQIVVEYLSRSQVQGYSLIVQTDRPLYERLLWTLITVFNIVITFYLVINSYVTFLESPTVTSEAPIKTPILELNFPAVSVCNGNRISRRALMEYSRFMWVLNGLTVISSPSSISFLPSSLHATRNENQHIGRSVDEVFGNLVTIGQMYTLESSTDDLIKLETIHAVLQSVYGGEYSAHDIMSDVYIDTIWTEHMSNHFVNCFSWFRNVTTLLRLVNGKDVPLNVQKYFILAKHLWGIAAPSTTAARSFLS